MKKSKDESLASKMKHSIRWLFPPSNKRIFSGVYKSNLWGGLPGEFYSGPGSRSYLADQYVAAPKTFLVQESIRSVVDIGCGDFAIGERIAGFVNHMSA